MRRSVAMFCVGCAIALAMHLVASDRMPWRPDTVSMGIAFGAFGAVAAWRYRDDRERNRRLWQVLKQLRKLA
jgi:hypothetical protein